MMNENQKHSHARQACLSAAAVALGLVAPAHAFNPQPDPPGTHPVAVTVTQTAEVHVMIAPGSEVSGIEPTPFIPGSEVSGIQPTPFAVGIYDELGRLVASAAGRLMPGTISSIAVAGVDLGLRGAERRLVYAVVQCLGGAIVRMRCAQSVKADMEIFDTDSGRTSVLLPVVVAVVPVLPPEVTNRR